MIRSPKYNEGILNSAEKDRIWTELKTTPEFKDLWLFGRLGDVVRKF